jgi:hypothetical protein
MIRRLPIAGWQVAVNEQISRFFILFKKKKEQVSLCFIL